MHLNSDNLSTLSRLLDEALDLPEAEHGRWLQSLPEEHHYLLPRLRDMLAQHGSADHADYLSSGPQLSDPSKARPADVIGPYRLIREIGRGGMGTVWLADGSLKRQVALKLPRLTWGDGLAERMGRERDIGALLEHPHIARLYDAGVDSLGRPYLALEYIDGQPLDVWCESRALSVPERLRLFLQIARAVAYAHGRLVVHRDLKPSNVLITADGEAHLLDFGIAKLLHEAAAGDEQLTRELGRAMTPNYASPEQLRGEAITVGSDVYSLGVLLYEMLTGRLPHEVARKSMAALEEAILHGEPALASSRAGHKKLASALKGELDAILAKALKRDPAQRYATADAFADDIERHLSGARVLAQPDSLAYRLRKTLRQHRAPFAAATAIGLAVVAGAVVSLMQARRANDEAERARAVQTFVVDVLKVRQSSSDTLLERSAGLIDTQFAGRPELQAELFGVVSGLFHGVVNSRLAEKYAARQLEVLERLGTDDSKRAEAMLLLARAHVQQDHLATAETLVRRALPLATGGSPLEAQTRLLLVDVLTRKSQHTLAFAQLDEVDRLVRTSTGAPSAEAAEALAARASLQASTGQAGNAAIDALFNQAVRVAEQAEGKLSRRAVDIRLKHAYQLVHWLRNMDAKAQVHAAVDTMQALGSFDDIGAAVAEADVLGEMTLVDLVPPRFAAQNVEPARDSLIRQGPRVPAAWLARVEMDLAGMHLRSGDVDRADEFSSRAGSVLPTLESTAHRRGFTAVMSEVAANRGRHDQAEALARESLALRQLETGDDAWQLVHSQLLIVGNLIMEQRFDAALALLAQLPSDLPDNRKGQLDDLQKADWVRLHTILLQIERGDPRHALTLLDQEDMSRMRVVRPTMQPNLLRGRALCAAGMSLEGLPLFEEQIEVAAGASHVWAPAVAHLRGLAGLCALDAGQRQRAKELSAMARAAFTHQPVVSRYYQAPLLQLEQRLRKG